MRAFLSSFTSATLSLSLLINPSGDQSAIATPTTPIQHVVVIFGENISFDHYFGTYPKRSILPVSRALVALAGHTDR